MTTPRDQDHRPDDPSATVVHTSRRAALAAERAEAERARPRRRPSVPTRTARVARTPSTAARTPSTTSATSPAPRVVAVRRGPVRRVARFGRLGVTSAIAAFAMFSASAMPAHASAGSSPATASIAPAPRGQQYAVTAAVARDASAAASDRDAFTVDERRSGTAGSAVTTGEDAIRSPFPGPVPMSSGFGYRSAPCGACSSLHQGLDFTPGAGTPIGSVAAGTVRVAGTYFSYGSAVIIDHVVDGRKVSTLYGHLQPGSSPLRVGQRVAPGEFIGRVGNSGVSTGAHLHLEVLMDGTLPVDPAAWLESHTGRAL